MATRFRTSGPFPTGTWSGQQLSSGAADGNFYAVDRNAAAKSNWGDADYLVDNVGANSAQWNGVDLPSGVTSGNVMTLNGTADWTPTAGRYVCINRTIQLNSGRFCKISANASDIYFINCNFVVTGGRAWPTHALGCYPDSNSGADRTANYGPQSDGTIGANGGMMLWGCIITNTATNSPGVGVAEIIGTSFGGNPTSSFSQAFLTGGRYISSDISGNGSSDTGPQMYGRPSASGLVMYRQGFSNLGQSAGATDVAPTLFDSPIFTVPNGQSQLYSTNVDNTNKITQVVNGYNAGTSASQWMASGGTGSNYDGTWKFGWGGGTGGWNRAEDGLTNYVGFTPVFRDLNQTGIKNVRFRVSSNYPLNTIGANLVARFTTNAATANQDLIQSFVTDTNGRLTTESYSTNGTTFTNGYINMLTGTTTATQNVTDWNINASGQKTFGSLGQALVPINSMRMTGLNTPAFTQADWSWSARSFTNDVTFAGATLVANTGNTQIMNVDQTQFYPPEGIISDAARTAMNATSTGNIDSYFDGLVTANVTGVNCYEWVRYQWFNYASGVASPNLANGILDLGSQPMRFSTQQGGGVVGTPSSFQIVVNSGVFGTNGVSSLALTGFPAGVGLNDFNFTYTGATTNNTSTIAGALATALEANWPGWNFTVTAAIITATRETNGVLSYSTPSIVGTQVGGTTATISLSIQNVVAGTDDEPSAGFNWDGTQWTFRSSAPLADGITRMRTSGAIAVLEQATTNGNYITLQGGLVNLAGTTLYQNIQSTTSISGLPSSGLIAQNCSVGFGTNSALSMTANNSFVGATITGSCVINPSTTGLVMTLQDCGNLTTFPFTNSQAATRSIGVVATGNTVLPATLPNGFVINYSIVVAGTGDALGGAVIIYAGNNIVNSTTSLTAAGLTGSTTSPITRVLWGKSGFNFVAVENPSSMVTITPQSSGLSGNNPAPAWTSSFTGGVTPAVQIGVTNGTASAPVGSTETYQRLEFLKGGSTTTGQTGIPMLRALNQALINGDTVADFFSVLNGVPTLGTEEIDFISSDGNAPTPNVQRFITGIALANGVTFGQITSDLGNSAGNPQVVNGADPTAALGTVITAVEQATDPSFGVINRNVQKASLLIPASENLPN